MSKQFDVVVVGSGPGGYVAAIRASQLGKKVAIVERENLGGICLNWGCIPTKALLKSAEIYHNIMHAEDFGFKVSGTTVDVKKIIERSRGVAGNLSGGIGFLMKKNNVEVIMGNAKFRDAHHLEVTNEKGEITETVSFENAIIATGARPRQIPGVLEIGGDVWGYREAMTPETLPKSLLVIGSGAIGIEFASFYQTLGSDVHVVEALDRIMPAEDAEISKIAEKAQKKRGLKISTKAMVKSLKKVSGGMEATIEKGGKETQEVYEKVLLAIGVVANVENTGLEELGIRLEKGVIKTDTQCRTNISNIYAIGDAIGHQQLAHVASHEGVVAAEAIAGKHPHGMDYSIIPGCTYCEPQVGSVGYTEAKAKEAGYSIKVGRFNYQANGKAQAIGADEGLVKTIFNAETGELLGAHIIGAEATEMITTFVLGRSMEATEADFIHACLPHPTLSEMIAESVLDSEGRTLNS